MSNDPDALRMLASQINYETAVSNGMDRWERDTIPYEHLKTTQDTPQSTPPKPSEKTSSLKPSSKVIAHSEHELEELKYQLDSAKEELLHAKSSDCHGSWNYWDKEVRRIEKEILCGKE